VSEEELASGHEAVDEGRGEGRWGRESGEARRGEARPTQYKVVLACETLETVALVGDGTIDVPSSLAVPLIE
jgi:hypothetical protein